MMAVSRTRPYIVSTTDMVNTVQHDRALAGFPMSRQYRVDLFDPTAFTLRYKLDIRVCPPKGDGLFNFALLSSRDPKALPYRSN